MFTRERTGSAFDLDLPRSTGPGRVRRCDVCDGIRPDFRAVSAEKSCNKNLTYRRRNRIDVIRWHSPAQIAARNIHMLRLVYKSV
jgi:hypothetical protein